MLGHGWAGQGYTAATIDPLARGVSWLLSETGIPRRVKTAYLTDDHIHDLAAYAAQLRRKETPDDCTDQPCPACGNTVKTSLTPNAAAGPSRTTSTPRSPGASCGPTPAASPPATSTPSPTSPPWPPTVEQRSASAVTRPARCSATPGPRSAPGSASPARPPSSAGEAPAMTAASGAAAAIAPEPEHGLGAGGNSRRRQSPSLDLTTAWERQLASTGSAALTPSGCTRPHHRRFDLATGRGAHPVYDTASPTPSAGRAARRVRQPPRIRLPGLLGGLQARRPPARPRGPDRRQGRPRIGRCAPVRVRHPHRPVLRPGPRPPRCAARPCCRAAPAATPTSGRCPHGRDISCPVRHAETTRGSAARCARDCYDYEAAVLFNCHAGDAVAAVHHLPAPPPGPRSPGVTGKRLRASCASASSRSPNTRHAASSTSTP